MFTFRQKIFLGIFAISLIFIIFLYPLMKSVMESTQKHSLEKRVAKLITSVKHSSDMDEIIEKLKLRKPYLFFRISLLDPRQGYLFDSHQKVNGGEFEGGDLLSYPEVEEALSEGLGYDVRYSSLFEQEMAYMALPFRFHGSTLVMRAAFPYGQVIDLTHDLTFTFLVVGIVILVLFSFLVWLILHYFTSPVKAILQAIRPFQLGQEDRIREIRLRKWSRSQDEFSQLAMTLNALSERIDTQIASLVHERNEKSAILESLIEGVVAVDEEMNVVYMNPMAETFLEMQLEGRNFSEARQPECVMLIMQAAKERKPVLGVLHPERKQKTYFDALAIPRGDRGGAILVLQDKTARYKVLELGRDFIANASHELKTPITIIRGFAETLHDHPELSPEVSHEITEKIVSNCGRMETLVKNLLTLAAVDEGLPQSRLSLADLVDIVGQARQMVLTVHKEAEIRIRPLGEEPFRILLDSDLFFQAILNLLENGVKYSKPPAKIDVIIEKRSEEFVIQVKDRGVGIPQEDLERIFERFYAVDKSHSRSLGGSGLGLSIVERIIEKHKGKIEVESRVGHGTTFTITLPIRSRTDNIVD